MNTSPNRSPLKLWWLNPASVFLVSGVVIGIAAYLIDESSYRAYWRTPKFFDERALLITFACIAVFGVGASAAMSAVRRAVPMTSLPDIQELAERVPSSILLTVFRITFSLTLIGYGLWIGLAIQRGITPEVVIGVAAGQKGAIYEARFNYLPTVAGVTTMAEFGTGAAILGALYGSIFGWVKVRRALAILLLLAVVRALLNSERIAIIELVVPFAMTCLPFWLSSGSWLAKPKIKTLVKLAPILGTSCLWLLFTTFEYFRSWKNYYSGGDLGLWSFGAVRLLGYYVTSFNNGAFLLARLDPLNAPYFMLHFLWLFPLTNPIVHRLFPNPLLDTSDRWFYFPFIEGGANLEFNNADGFLNPLMDYGIAAGLIYWLLVGAACGLMYELYRRKHVAGLIFYPAIFFGLIEAPLALFWAEGRYIPSLMMLALAPIAFRIWGSKRFQAEASVDFRSRSVAAVRPNTLRTL